MTVRDIGLWTKLIVASSLCLLRGLPRGEAFTAAPNRELCIGAAREPVRVGWRTSVTPRRTRAARNSDSSREEEQDPYRKVANMLEEDSSTDYIFENNRKWVESSLEKDPEMFSRHAKSQHPKYFYIGCSDSRVDAQDMMGLSIGDVFVMRNIGNLCVSTDHSMLAALQYSVEVLGVTDVVVCGHYGCGAVRAAMENVDHGLLEHWLMNIRNVQRLHLEELEALPDTEARYRRLVELNVQESCMNLFANPIVQKKQATASQPRIHGWVYDIETGRLKKLNIDFKSEIRKYRDVYRLYEFPRRTKMENESMTPRKKDAVGRTVSNLPIFVFVEGSFPWFTDVLMWNEGILWWAFSRLFPLVEWSSYHLWVGQYYIACLVLRQHT